MTFLITHYNVLIWRLITRQRNQHCKHVALKQTTILLIFLVNMEFKKMSIIESTKKKQSMLSFLNNYPATQTETENPSAGQNHRFLICAERRCAAVLNN